MSGRNHPKPGHAITHHVAGARHSAPRTEIRLGARHGAGTGERGTAHCARPEVHPDDLTSIRLPLPRRAMIGTGRPGLKVVRPAGRST